MPHNFLSQPVDLHIGEVTSFKTILPLGKGNINMHFVRLQFSCSRYKFYEMGVEQVGP
jgi:hypothetical protein